jgi:DNA-binding Lrp family transcriptional regulator
LSSVIGGFDCVLKVVARDVDHCREIMDDMVAAEVGVERFSSFISLQHIKQSRGFPLGLICVDRPHQIKGMFRQRCWLLRA